MNDVVVIEAGPARLMHPTVKVFSAQVSGALASGAQRIVIDLAKVEYLDSAAIGCLMDLFRQSTAAGATLKLAGVQPRVETMLTLTGANQFLEIYPDAAAAARSF